MRGMIVAAGALLLGGCMAYNAGRAAVKVATFPVRAGAKAVDWATTSQSEADRNRGRTLREAEEREARAREKAERRARGDRRADRPDADGGATARPR